jgi:hypothetical protein
MMGKTCTVLTLDKNQFRNNRDICQHPPVRPIIRSLRILLNHNRNIHLLLAFFLRAFMRVGIRAVLLQATGKYGDVFNVRSERHTVVVCCEGQAVFILSYRNGRAEHMNESTVFPFSMRYAVSNGKRIGLAILTPFLSKTSKPSRLSTEPSTGGTEAFKMIDPSKYSASSFCLTTFKIISACLSVLPAPHCRQR